MRLALLYSDGSINVLSPDTTLARAIAERDDCDFNLRDREHRTRIAYVVVELRDILSDQVAESAATGPTRETAHVV